LHTSTFTEKLKRWAYFSAKNVCFSYITVLITKKTIRRIEILVPCYLYCWKWKRKCVFIPSVKVF